MTVQLDYPQKAKRLAVSNGHANACPRWHRRKNPRRRWETVCATRPDINPEPVTFGGMSLKFRYD